MTRANPFANPHLQECVVPGSAGVSSALLNSQDAEHQTRARRPRSQAAHSRAPTGNCVRTESNDIFHVERRTEQRRGHRCGVNFQARFRSPSFYSCLLLHSIALYRSPHLPKLANRLSIATWTRQTPEPTPLEAAAWQCSSARSAHSGLKTPADGRSCGSFWAFFSVSSRCSSCSTKTRKTSKPSRGGARTTRLRPDLENQLKIIFTRQPCHPLRTGV